MTPNASRGPDRRTAGRLIALLVAVFTLGVVALTAAPAEAAPAYARGVQASAPAAAPAAPIVAGTTSKACYLYLGTGYVVVNASISQSFRAGYSSVHETIRNAAGRAVTLSANQVRDASTIYHGPGGWRPNGGAWDWTAPTVRTSSAFVFVAAYSTTNPYQADSCSIRVG